MMDMMDISDACHAELAISSSPNRYCESRGPGEKEGQLRIPLHGFLIILKVIQANGLLELFCLE